MVVSVQTVLNSACIAGGCCAMGLPVALHSINIYESKRKVTISYCDLPVNEHLPTVNFGDKTSKRVCWYIQPNGQAQKAIMASEEYTKLFMEKWDQGSEKDKAWNFESENKWSQQCEKTEQKWGITSVESGVEYFGLCSTSLLQKTPFLKKQIEDSESSKKLKLQVCDNDCWDNVSVELEGTKFWQKWKKDNWKDVVFKRKR